VVYAEDPVYVLSDITVRARCPQRGGDGTPALLPKNSTFHEVIDIISGATEFEGFANTKILVWVDQPSGWSRDLTENCLKTCDLCMSLFDVRDGDVIEVRRELGAAVGSKYRLSFLAAFDQHSALVGARVEELVETYPGYRRIRGDGNCYYRAMVFGLLEQVIQRGDLQDFRHLYDVFNGVDIASYLINVPLLTIEQLVNNHANLLLKLGEAAEGRAWRSVPEFEADVLTESTGIDLALIRACKTLVATSLVRQQDKDMYGIPLRETIVPCENAQ
jgi:hypothetical protein